MTVENEGVYRFHVEILDDDGDNATYDLRKEVTVGC